MKGLLIKDFKLMKGQKNFFLAIVAIALAMITLSPGTSFPSLFVIMDIHKMACPRQQ